MCDEDVVTQGCFLEETAFFYDEWGNPLDTTGSMKLSLGLYNPLCYMATYNACPIRKLPENSEIRDRILHDVTWVGHGIDVVPYLIWGNCPEDTSTFIDRIMLSF